MRDGWVEKPLVDVTLKIGSGATPRGGKSVYVDTGTAFIRSQNVYDREFSAEQIARINADAAKQLAGVAVQPSDVLVCITGESVTRTCLVPTSILPARVSQHVAIVRPDPHHIDPQFLLSALLDPPIKSRLNQLSEAGATRRALTKSHLENTRIMLPPLAEQRRIAAVLASLDDLVDTNLRILGAIDAYATTAFLQAWDGTTRASLSELGTLTMGQSPPGDTYNEVGLGTPFHQGIRDFGVRFPSDRVYCTAPSRIADEGDILIAVRAPVGTTNVANKRTAMGRGVAGLKANHPAITLQALRVDPNTWSAHQGTGTVFSSINKAELLRLQVPYVDDAALEARLNTLDVAYGGLSTEVDGLRRTRDELLPLLMSGAVSPGEVTVAS